ncbi:hypothetical protein SPRG_15286 [Saprolegnia parasitica CBS 223.65]|uniref:PLOD1-3-like GT domain-containing protein n=1 Tax=Saprolegnia parasitica (strain CBS 223.65) TaxID=695850 RepID=A0A067BIV2_SAPPC|nr:hypothetical protein SPRG_15286 [Saprolegnia parasitica CBS 223.65]KDO18339.1 hypothetical protein SPRG_15286 [Saprolegnia parasitica CBS 223.65]|eukprot:XP_012210951.1 hypothetical protein SPRG_15286 [Saprolegnia parasitica CBS 223.65]
MLRAKPFVLGLGCLALFVIVFNTLSVVHLAHLERTLRQGGMPPRYTPRKLHFLTLADDTRPEICLVAAAVHATGHQLQVLAWNHSTNFFDNTSCGAQCGANTANDFRVGQQKKTHWLHHYLASHPDLHDDDLLLYTDAYDVVVQMPLDVLTQRFLRQTRGQRGILFNAEPTCGDSFTLGGDYGDQLRAASFDHGTGPNLFLGSGGILGDVASVRAYLRRVKQVHKAQQDAYDAGTSPFFFYGDQISFQLAYVQFPELNAQVDRDGDIFFVVSSGVGHGTFEHLTPNSGCSSAYYVNGSGSLLTWSGSAPVFFHFPGGFKFMYASCARAVTAHLVHTAKQPPVMYDVDRQRPIAIASICPEYAPSP